MANLIYESARDLQASLVMGQRLAPTSELLRPAVLNDLHEDSRADWACLVQRRDQLLAEVDAWVGEVI